MTLCSNCVLGVANTNKTTGPGLWDHWEMCHDLWELKKLKVYIFSLMKSVCVMWDLCGEIIVQLSNIFAPDPWNPHFVTTTTLEPDTSLCPVYAAYICDSGGNVITKFKPASLRRYSPRPVNPDGAPRTRERGPTKTQRLQPWCSDKLWGCYFRSVSTWKSIEHHPNMSHPQELNFIAL